MPEKIYFRSDLIELISHYKSLRETFAEKARRVQKENFSIFNSLLPSSLNFLASLAPNST